MDAREMDPFNLGASVEFEPYPSSHAGFRAQFTRAASVVEEPSQLLLTNLASESSFFSNE
jgi:hypothetical protein